MTELIINTKYGKVEGFVEDGVSRWYGIPYAKPPIGDLRFRRPTECDNGKMLKNVQNLVVVHINLNLKQYLVKKMILKIVYI